MLCWLIDQRPQLRKRKSASGKQRSKMLYQTITADPPWPYRDVNGPRVAPSLRPKTWNGVSGAVGSALRYGSMSLSEICALKPQAASNAHLYLWTTNSFLVEAHEVARAWGFKTKTLLTWIKVKSDGTPSMKAGHYYRGATEHILFAVKGSLKLMGPPAPTAYLSPRLPHSVKPAWFYSLVEEQSPGPYLEMFARKTREGWDSWGNDVQVANPLFAA